MPPAPQDPAPSGGPLRRPVRGVEPAGSATALGPALLTLAVAGAVFAALDLAIGTPRDAATACAAFAWFVAVWLGRRRLGRGAGWLAGLGLLGIGLHTVTGGGGIHDVGMVLFPSVILIANLTLSGRGALALTLLTIAAAVAVGLAEYAGALPARPKATRLDTLVNLAALFTLIALLTRILVGGVQRALAQARASERAYREVFDATQDPIFVHDAASGRVLDVNEAALRRYGITRQEAPELPADMLSSGVPPFTSTEALAHIRRAVEAGPQTFEWLARTRDGRLFWAEVSLRCSRIGDRDCVLAVVRDIDERKREEERRARLEAQLRQAQKLEAVGQLAGGIAHDFNNLLTAILSFGHFTLGSLEDDHPAREDVRELLHAAERAAGLTRQLLAFSRREVVAPRPLDLGEAVEGLTGTLHRVLGETIALDVRAGPGAGHVRADPAQIEQVILNLALNARDAMPAGGRLTVAVEELHAGHRPPEQEAPLPAGPLVALTVSDTGHGMDAATQARIFEPFFSTKGAGAGTGLGLATVHGIVAQCGGDIRVESAPGKGATFRVYLPRCDEAAATEAEERPSLPAGTETLLVVEDDDAVRALATRALRALGYQVLEAEGVEGAEALGAAQDRLDLLVTDVVLRRGSGRELAERLLARRPALRVLYCSGYTADEVLRHGVKAQGLAFLPKPYTPEVLARKVRQVLDAPAPPARAADPAGPA